MQGVVESNLLKETLNINKRNKKKRLKKKRKNNLQMINSKFILNKKKPNDFRITYKVSKRIKNVEMEMEEEIDFEYLESEILEMEEIRWQILT